MLEKEGTIFSRHKYPSLGLWARDHHDDIIIMMIFGIFSLLLLHADDDAAREAHLKFPGFLGDGSILTSQLAAGACKIVTAVEAARR